MNIFSLKGKVALVTGAAHGIGFSMAAGLAQSGATVVFNSSNQASLDKGLAEYKKIGPTTGPILIPFP